MTYTEEYWNKRIPTDTPDHIKRALKRIYSSYPPDCMPQGLADPMYIMNVLAYEVGFGDGQGNFHAS